MQLSTFHGNVCTASRTDAGVHAIENISHVDIYHYDKNKNLKDPYPAETVYRALNHYMRKNHEDIVIGRVERVDDVGLSGCVYACVCIRNF